MHAGVIDSDFVGRVKVMLSILKEVAVILPGDSIAQMLVLPSLHPAWFSRPKIRGLAGFGSSGDSFVNLLVELSNRPLLTLTINGKRFGGLLDTGADKSMIRQCDWPPKWALMCSTQTLWGLGIAAQPQQSAAILHWQDSEGHVGTFHPYVCPTPLCYGDKRSYNRWDLS